MIEVCFLIVIYLFGWSYLRLFLLDLDRASMVVAAVPVGLTIWVLATILTLILQISYSFWIPLTIASLILIAANRVYGDLIKKPEAFLLLKILIPICVASGVLQYYDWTIVASDSLFMFAMGKHLSHHGEFTEGMKALFSSFSSFIPMIQMPAFWFGIEYFKSFLPLCAISTLGMFVVLGQRIISMWWPNNRWITLGMPMLAVAMLTTFFPYSWGSFYLKTTSMYGFGLFIGCTSAWLAVAEDQPKWLGVTVFAILSTMTLRLEAGLTTLPLLVVAFSLSNLSVQTRAMIFAPLGLLFGGWYAFVIMESFARGMFSVYQLFGIGVLPGLFGLIAGALICAKTPRLDRFFGRLVQHLPNIMIGSILIFILAYSGLNSRDAVNALNKFACFIGNPEMGMTYFWSGMAALTVFAILVKSSMPHQKIFVYVILSYLLVVLAIAIQAPWKHCGSHDSTNRILVNIVPTLIFYMLVRFTACFRRQN